jgi:hypothetical protein
VALNVETGAGSANSEAYASVADFKSYCDARGISYAALSDAQIEQRLRLGADYMVSVYRDAWAGNRVSSTQALDWPRQNVTMKDGPGQNLYPDYYPNNAVPDAVKRANIELANRAGSPLIPDETQAVKRKKVGPVEVEYADYSRATRTYRAIDTLLAPLLAAGGGVKVVRA